MLSPGQSDTAQPWSDALGGLLSALAGASGYYVSDLADADLGMRFMQFMQIS